MQRTLKATCPIGSSPLARRRLLFLLAMATAATAALADSMQWQLVEPGTPLRGHARLVRLTDAGVTWLRIETRLMVPQVWVLENDVWERRLEEVHPPPRSLPVMAYDSLRDVVVRFGGWDENLDVVAETWEYDGDTWVERLDVGSPPPRVRTTMAFDSARGVMVLFGGLTGLGGSDLGDLWEYDGVSWQPVSPAPPPLPAPPAPPARYDASMAYDEARGTIVLGFGYSRALGTSLTDTWEYDGLSWILPAGPVPLPREEASMAYDPVRRRVWVFGGERDGVARTEYWTGSGWHEVAAPVSPPARNDAGFAFDDDRAELLLHGGQAYGGGGLADLWSFDGTRWVEVPQPQAPAPRRAYWAMAFDESVGRAVTHGGRQCCPIVYRDQTWEWDGSDWSEVLPPSGPGIVYRHAMVYDPQRGESILFGGFETGYGPVDRTWSYDAALQVWSELPTSNRPPARSGMAMTYSPLHGGALLFGGDDGLDLLDDTWVLRNGDWESITGTPRPSPRESMALAYEEAPGRIVVYGGDGPGGEALDPVDTWVLDESGWTELAASGPGRRVGARMVYDPSRQKLVLVGGAGDADVSESTWEFDGTTWIPVATRYSPSMRRHDPDMIWHPGLEVVLLGAGRPQSGDLANDLWAYGRDEDDDGSVGGYDNCPSVVNPDQADADADAAGDACDCAAADPGTFAPPLPVAGLRASGKVSTSVEWDDQVPQVGPDVTYDLVTGLLRELGAAGDFGAAQCLAPALSTPAYTDTRSPPAGDGFYYLARARNACGTGSYGPTRGNLDAASPCP